MQSVNIRTTQNVAIDYDQAGLGSRIGAFLIDIVIMGVYMIFISFVLGRLNINSMWLFMLFYLPVFFYHLICEIVLNGQSVGKKQLNIKVVRLDGSSPTIGGYILRWILRPIDIGVFSGAIAVIAIAMSERGQRLGDMAAGTTVVKLEKQVDISSHQLIKKVQVDYDVTFPEVRNLSDQHVLLIREALRANKEQANIKPVMAVAKKLKEHLSVSTDLPPVKFLYTVLKDYNHVTSQA